MHQEPYQNLHARPRYPDDAWDLLSPKLSDLRRERMLHVVSLRSDYIRLMVQDLTDPHNISACMRSADAFGVLNVDVVTKNQKFSPSTAARGSGQWLTIKRWRQIADAAHAIKAQGYCIAGGYPREDACSIYDLPVDKPLVVLLGNEHDGLDEEWLPHLDYSFKIPMQGMVESLNISVCAAISLLEVTRRALALVGPEHYYIAQAKQRELLCEWICRFHSRRYETELNKLRSQAQTAVVD